MSSKSVTKENLFFITENGSVVQTPQNKIPLKKYDMFPLGSGS